MLEYASVAWKSTIIIDSFATEDSFKILSIIMIIFLEKLNSWILYIRWRHPDAIFFINAYNGAKYCPSGIETDGISVTAWNICNFPVLNVTPIIVLQLNVLLLSL